MGPQLLGKRHSALESIAVGIVPRRTGALVLAARFHHKGGARATERLGQVRRRADDARSGGIAGHQRKHIIAACRVRHRRFSRGAGETVGRPTQGYLAQCGQIRTGEEMGQRRAHPLGCVDLARLQPLDELCRLHVDNLHRIGRIEDAIGNTLARCHGGHGRDAIVEPLQMLHVHRGVHVDAGPQQFLHILIALTVAAARRIGMGQLVYEHDLRGALKGSVQIEFPQRDPTVLDRSGFHNLQAVQKSKRVGTGVGLYIAHHDVGTSLLGPVRLGEHGIGLAHPGRIAEEHLQLTARRSRRTLPIACGLFLANAPENGVGIAADRLLIPVVAPERHHSLLPLHYLVFPSSYHWPQPRWFRSLNSWSI